MSDLLDALRVEVWMPTPGAAFTLDTNRLGPYTPTQPRLGAPEDAGDWVELLGDAISVQTRRGGPRSFYNSEAQTGTFHATIRNRPDVVLGAELRPGLPLRVSLPTGTRLFTGTVLDIDTAISHEPFTGKQILTTTLVGVDAVHQLANTTRYGAKVTGGEGQAPYIGEYWVDRIHRLMRSAGNVPYVVDDTGAWYGGQTHASTDMETNLANFLDITNNSVQALWCVDRDGVAQFRSHVLLDSNLPRFTDGTTAPGSDLHYNYTDINYDFGTRDLITSLTFACNWWSTVTQDFATNEISWTDETLAATYGHRAATIDVTRVPNRNNLNSLASRYLTAFRAGRANVRSITVDASTNPVAIAEVDLCKRIRVRVPDPVSEWADLVVTGIDHDVTPERWLTTFHLMRRYP